MTLTSVFLASLTFRPAAVFFCVKLKTLFKNHHKLNGDWYPACAESLRGVATAINEDEQSINITINVNVMWNN